VLRQWYLGFSVYVLQVTAELARTAKYRLLEYELHMWPDTRERTTYGANVDPTPEPYIPNSRKRPRRTRQNVLVHAPGFPGSWPSEVRKFKTGHRPPTKKESPMKSGSMRFNDRVYSNFGYDSGDGRKRVARSGHGPGPRSTALRRNSIRRFRAGHDENEDENV
jgi:hypothetical protein